LLLYFILSQVSDGLKAMKGSPEVTSEIVDRVEKKRRDLYDVLKMRPGSMGDRVYWNWRDARQTKKTDIEAETFEFRWEINTYFLFRSRYFN